MKGVPYSAVYITSVSARGISVIARRPTEFLPFARLLGAVSGTRLNGNPISN